jgi:putative transcriptional regulator
MPIIYNIDVIQALKNAGYTPTRIRKEKILGESVLTSIRNKQLITLQSLEKLCELLDCQPGDLISYQKL